MEPRHLVFDGARTPLFELRLRQSGLAVVLQARTGDEPWQDFQVFVVDNGRLTYGVMPRAERPKGTV